MSSDPFWRLFCLPTLVAIAVAGCSDVAVPPDAGTGGVSGTGGTGGPPSDGVCTNAKDVAVYADLGYTNEAGDTFTGPDATSEMGTDCLFGAPSSTPALEGCQEETTAIIRCFPNCAQETIDAAADCVALCVQAGTAEAAPPGLSSECAACTGDTVACGVAYCTDQCVVDINAPMCIDCRCDNNCIQEFDSCSGLPSGGECF